MRIDTAPLARHSAKRDDSISLLFLLPRHRGKVGVSALCPLLDSGIKAHVKAFSIKWKVKGIASATFPEKDKAQKNFLLFRVPSQIKEKP